MTRPRLALCFALAAVLCAQPLCAADMSKLQSWKGATPKLQLKDLDGKPQDIARYRGKVVVLNFWATWCTPCVKEMPALQRLSEKLSTEPFALVTVNFGESEKQIRPFMEKLGVRFPVLLDRDMRATEPWVDKGLPTTFVIDSNQKIRYRVLGDFEWDAPEVEARIRELLPKR
jgi:thiol-disulfide isomerase/thioredoxin